MKTVILAAGVGSRLESVLPKSLNKLPNGKTIIENQINILRKLGIKEIFIVVGFKKEIVMENYSNVFFVYNPLFHISNTAYSLRLALENMDEDDVIWMNGDVALEKEVIKRVIEKEGNAVAVNKSKCGEEEVKYKTKDGKIVEVSKNVVDAEGEAVGVNKISKKDFYTFLQALKECNKNDYFEKGMELAINKGIDFYPVDISDCRCIEVDFKDDLETVREVFK
jgi:choline kinase